MVGRREEVHAVGEHGGHALRERHLGVGALDRVDVEVRRDEARRRYDVAYLRSDGRGGALTDGDVLEKGGVARSVRDDELVRSRLDLDDARVARPVGKGDEGDAIREAVLPLLAEDAGCVVDQPQDGLRAERVGASVEADELYLGRDREPGLVGHRDADAARSREHEVLRGGAFARDRDVRGIGGAEEPSILVGADRIGPAREGPAVGSVGGGAEMVEDVRAGARPVGAGGDHGHVGVGDRRPARRDRSGERARVDAEDIVPDVLDRRDAPVTHGEVASDGEGVARASRRVQVEVGLCAADQGEEDLLTEKGHGDARRREGRRVVDRVDVAVRDARGQVFAAVGDEVAEVAGAEAAPLVGLRRAASGDQRLAESIARLEELHLPGSVDVVAEEGVDGGGAGVRDRGLDLDGAAARLEDVVGLYRNREVAIVGGRWEGEAEARHDAARVHEVEQVVRACCADDGGALVRAVVQDHHIGRVGRVLDVDERRHLLEVVALPDVAALAISVDDVATVGADPEHDAAGLLDHDLDLVVGEQEVAEAPPRQRTVDQIGGDHDLLCDGSRGSAELRRGAARGGRVHDLELPLGVPPDRPSRCSPVEDAVAVPAVEGQLEASLGAEVGRPHEIRSVRAPDEHPEEEKAGRGPRDEDLPDGTAGRRVRVPEARSAEGVPAAGREIERLVGVQAAVDDDTERRARRRRIAHQRCRAARSFSGETEKLAIARQPGGVLEEEPVAADRLRRRVRGAAAVRSERKREGEPDHGALR